MATVSTRGAPPLVIPKAHGMTATLRFLRTEVFAPEKLPGNLSILTGATLFFGGIAALRTWGELMVPA